MPPKKKRRLNRPFVPKLIYGFDTEDKDGETTMYALDGREGSVLYQASDLSRMELIRYLTHTGENVAVFCLNIQYDLVNLFGASLLDQVQPFCARKRFVGARLRGAGQVRFYDIARFLPKMNLAELGKLVGVPKLDLPFEDPRRVVRDAKIARVVGERIVRELDKLKITLKFSPTSGALQALELENEGHLPRADAASIEFGKASLYGGRTEVYYCGRWKKSQGDLYYFDFNAAYGRAMLEDLPDFSGNYFSREPKEDMYLADVDVRTEEIVPGVGPIPFRRKDGGLCFPVGTFRGIYTDVDLSLPGVEVVKYHRTLNFKGRGPFLRPLVHRLMPGPKTHPFTKALRKNLYTSLSGKFAQSAQFTLFIKLENAKDTDQWNGIPFGDWMLVEREGRPPRTTNYVWSSYIQARNRAWQYEMYMAIHAAGGRVLYGDTDSALAYVPSAMAARKIQESQYLPTKMVRICEAELLSPKVYRMEKADGSVILSTKGVPRRLIPAAVHLGEDVIVGEVPDTFFHLLKSNYAEGTLRNRWKRRTWKFHKINSNRMIDKNSPRTKPLTIDNSMIKLPPRQKGGA